MTPTDDFVGPLRAMNRQLVAVIAVLTVLELVLIYALSTRLTRPIEGVSRELRAMETPFQSRLAQVQGPSPRDRQLQDVVIAWRACAPSRATLPRRWCGKWRPAAGRRACPRTAAR